MAGRKQVDFERVIQTAVTLADEGGMETVTLANVAERLNIRIPSLYNHISGLPGLRSEIALWAARQLGDQIRRAAVGKSGDQAVVSIAHALRAFAHAHPGLYAIAQRPASADHPELVAAQTEVVDILVAVVEPYGFDSDDKLHIVRALRSVLHGFVDLEVAGGFGLALDRDESFRRLLDLLVVGLRARVSTRQDSAS